MKRLRKRLLTGVLILLSLLLAACGADSKEDVVKKLSTKWTEAKGYELDATMEIKTGAEPRLYDVNVWHTKPDFYRVKVNQAGDDNSQMIVRNEEGVFVVTPALRKTYKFQSDWPKQNSQAYLIGALAEDIKADAKSVMREEEKSYVFETQTRNNHQKMLPYQHIYIDKKTMLPTKVSVLNENKEEQISITFKKITLGTSRDATDYAVEKFTESKEDQQAGADLDNKDFQTTYPVLNSDMTVVEEKTFEDGGSKRVIMTFASEDKDFTLIQQAAEPDATSYLPVFAAGDPADLGFAIGAITDHSISWEQNGISYFIASNTLSRDEMIEVAASMALGEDK